MNATIYEYSIIIAGAFAGAYSLSWGFTRDNFKAYKRYYNIGLGIFFSILSTITVFILGVYNADNVLGDFIYLTPILFYFCIAFFTSVTTSSIVLCFNWVNIIWLYIKIPYVYFFPINKLTMYFIISIYVIIFCLSTAKKILVKFNFRIKDIEVVSLLTIALFFVDIVIKYDFNVNDSTFNFKINIWFVFLFFIYSSFCIIVDSIYYHAVKLSNVVKYDEEYYINSENIQSETIKFLGDNKVKFGMYVNFFIKEYDDFEKLVAPKIRESIISFITEKMHKKVISEISKNILFFKNNRKTYGMIIPIDSEISNKQYLDFNSTKEMPTYQSLEKILNSIPTKFKIENYELRLTIKSVCSIYGVDSNNTNNLFEMNNWYISNNEKTSKSIITVVNSEEYNNDKKTKRRVLALSEVVNINAMDIIYDPIYDLKEKKYNGYISKILLDKVDVKLSCSDKIISELEKTGMISTLIRYAGYKEVKFLNSQMIANKKYFIDYDASIISTDEFNQEEFMEKIKKNSINLKNLVLNINNISEVENFETLSSNILKLKKEGLKVCANNFVTEFEMFELLFKIHPDYLYVDNENISKIKNTKQKDKFVNAIIEFCEKLNCKPIATNIKKFQDIVWYKRLGINYVVGELVGSNIKINTEQTEELKYLLQKV